MRNTQGALVDEYWSYETHSLEVSGLTNNYEDGRVCQYVRPCYQLAMYKLRKSYRSPRMTMKQAVNATPR
jgi:hypothetical protein